MKNQTMIATILATRFQPGEVYPLSEIYHRVETAAGGQAALSTLQGWRHSVRGVLSHRKAAGRTIVYHGAARYSFH